MFAFLGVLPVAPLLENDKYFELSIALLWLQKYACMQAFKQYQTVKKIEFCLLPLYIFTLNSLSLTHAHTRTHTHTHSTHTHTRTQASEKMGYLNKMGPENKKRFTRRWFVLKGSELKYYRSHKDMKRPRGVIKLDSWCKLTSLSKSQEAFELATPQRTFQLAAKNSLECSEWMKGTTVLISSIDTVFNVQPKIFVGQKFHPTQLHFSLQQNKILFMW